MHKGTIQKEIGEHEHPSIIGSLHNFLLSGRRKVTTEKSSKARPLGIPILTHLGHVLIKLDISNVSYLNSQSVIWRELLMQEMEVLFLLAKKHFIKQNNEHRYNAKCKSRMALQEVCKLRGSP